MRPKFQKAFAVTRQGTTNRTRELARELRRHPTGAEREAWCLLRDRRCLGLRFRRQAPLAGFIVDFYCPQHRLAIEIDGGVHDDPVQGAIDQQRSEILRHYGIRIVRLHNDEIDDETLRHRISAALSPSPAEGEGAGG
jgi:very-short-patch-repair endonuclease